MGVVAVAALADNQPKTVVEMADRDDEVAAGEHFRHHRREMNLTKD